MASSSSLRGGREGGENRPLSAKPPKWEEQLRLAERLREIEVTCKTCLHGPWYHKPHDGGEGCYKHMISAGKVSSPLSVAELRKRGEASTAQTAEPVAEGDYTTDKTSKRPLAEYVRLEPKEGMALLFHPSPLDKWIGKHYKWDSKHQHHVDPSTGGILSPEESEDYRRYLQRYKERKQTGDQADKLVKLVGKCNPAVEEELRIYIGRFPGEIRNLLARGKQSPQRSPGEQRHGGTQDTRKAELRHGKKNKAEKVKTKKEQNSKKEKKKEGKKKNKKQTKPAKENKHHTAEDEGESSDSQKPEDVQHRATANPSPQEKDMGDPNQTHKTEDAQYHAAASSTPDEVDWGDAEDETEPHTAQQAATNSVTPSTLRPRHREHLLTSIGRGGSLDALFFHGVFTSGSSPSPRTASCTCSLSILLC